MSSEILATPLAAFLDNLRSEQPTPGPEEALAVAGAAAAALVVHATQAAQVPDVGREAETLTTGLKQVVERTGHETPGPGEIEAMLEIGRQSAAVLDLATRTLGHPRSPSPLTLPALAAAAALARGAAIGAVQQATLRLGKVEDNLARTTLRSKAEGIAQRARQAEADFQRALLVQGEV